MDSPNPSPYESAYRVEATPWRLVKYRREGDHACYFKQKFIVPAPTSAVADKTLLRLTDKINAALGAIATWLFVATGAMLCWEVTGRYVFNAPTIWAAELSQLAMIAAVFFSLGELQRRREHINVSLLRDRLPPAARRVADFIALGLVAAFSAVIVFYGGAIALDSYRAGSSTGTILNLPRWWAESALPVGFSLLLLQSVVGMVRVFADTDADTADADTPPAPTNKTTDGP